MGTSPKLIKLCRHPNYRELFPEDLIKLQRESYDWFLNVGLQKIFSELFPVEVPTGREGKFTIEFLGYRFGDLTVSNTFEAKRRKMSYARPLYIKLRLRIKPNRVDPEVVKESEVFLCELPMMTERGSFVFNGTERVYVNQLIRSPGIYRSREDMGSKYIYHTTVIATRAMPLDLETDVKKSATAQGSEEIIEFYPTSILRFKIERMRSRAKKVSATLFLRAMGFSYRDIIEELLFKYLKETEPGFEYTQEDLDLAERTLIEKFNVEEFVISSPKIQALVSKRKNLKAIIQLIVNTIRRDIEHHKIVMPTTVIGRRRLEEEQEKAIRVLYSKLIDESTRFVPVDVMREQVFVFFDPEKYDISLAGRYKLLKAFSRKLKCKVCGHEEIPHSKRCSKCGAEHEFLTTLDRQDFTDIVRYHLKFLEGLAKEDDLDHLGNRKLRRVGEQLYNQFKAGMIRFIRVMKERCMIASGSQEDITKVNISDIFTSRPVVGTIKQFFAQQGQLSQFLDQTNIIAELTHKRRISALGPGGLHKERAGYEVRDVKSTHYGRICPIETPEGSNIGLINSLALFADVNDFDFLVTPYYKVKNGVIDFNEVHYLDADDEDKYIIAPADITIDENGRIVDERIHARKAGELVLVKPEEVDYVDVSTRQIFGLSALLIPFIENDDANRALMGANMQRQAVPLVKPEAPLVATGVEKIATYNSGYLVRAKSDGEVVYVDASKIKILTEEGKEEVYELVKFARSNAGTLINQKPMVEVGQKVKKGQPIASGPSMDGDYLALGRNVLVAFLPLEGYNFEDAIVVSEELVRDDVYSSVHIEEFETKAVRTKLGDEEITREIPGVSEEELKNLDENGIIIPGTWVRYGNILVGKLTPEGESELSPEEKLLRAIFGEHARKVKDTSLRVPPGLRGKVMEVYEMSAKDVDVISEASNLIKMVLVYVAQYRNLQIGDKMAGRHGNKGVISKIMPVEDMPFLADGTPVQMVLNPLGVPSRMNVGQILETHLGLVCKLLGIRMEIPAFYRMTQEEIREWLKKALERELLDIMGDYKKAYSSKELLLLTMRRSGYTKRHVLQLLGFDREKLIERLTQAGLDPEKLKDYPTSQLEDLMTLDDLTDDEHKKAINKIMDNLLDGKFVLYDGKTGEPFKQPVTVGYMYMMKLIHLVEDKIHARSTGPYSLVTQQPLGGKAQFGGQRFGEMEVWALEAYGAAHTLQEMLTIKSDDITGRYKAYEAIVKDENIKLVSIPESFKVLVKELQALGLNIEIITKDDVKVIPRDYEMFELEDEPTFISIRM